MAYTSSKDVVDRYNMALGAKDFGAARRLLADDLHFQGPIDEFNRADDYVTAITRLYGMVKGIEHQATINNARRFGDLVAEFGTFAAYAWRFEPKPRSKQLGHADLMALGASSEAVAMSKDLRKRGWGFVGPTTVYSFMQAMGLVNDHLHGCVAGAEVERLRRSFKRPA